MGDVVQTIRLREVADVREVIQGIDEIQKNLGRLSLGPGLQSDFEKIFQRIERNAEKANKAIASGFKNKSDVTAYEDAVRQISTLYGEIITKVKVLNSSRQINLQVNDKDVENLNTEIDNLKNNLRDLKNKATQAGKGLRSALKEGARNNKGGAASWNDAVKAFEDGKIEETEKAIKRLETAVKAAQTRAKGAPLSDEWQKKADDVKAMREALDKYKSAQKDVNDEDRNLTIKKKELNDIMSKGADLLTKTANIGEKGAKAFGQYAKESANAAQNTQRLNSELDHFKNRVTYFFGISNAINLFKRALRSAYNTVKDLDKVMTETAVVTDFSVGDMWTKLPEYTQRANELGVSIHSAYEAATIFYQQGLKTNEVMAVSNETLKMARIAGLDAATASDRMTNALRGFNMEMDKVSAQRVNDVYSKLAAITASNTDEISTAMTKVASLAHNANMEFETTSAFLAQMIETTRESAETAGTALKTVVARFSEVKKLYSKGELLGNDEEGEEIDVNKVSTALRSADINLNEYLTGAKGLDDIFIELASKWDGLDKVQQRYIATMAAGSRQQSRFIAMMSDYKRTMELVEAANNANGASQEQYAKTLDSLETKLARLKNAWNEFVLGLANSNAIKGAIDILTNLLTVINKVISQLSGKSGIKKMIISFFTAFTAFKLGSSLVGKNNAIAKIFTTLTDASKVRVAQCADTIAGVYKDGLQTSLSKGFKNKLNNNALYNYFRPQDVNFKVDDVTKFQHALYKSPEMRGANINQKIAVNAAAATGDINKVNDTLKEQGIQLQINKTNYERLGVTCEQTAKRSVDAWRAAGAAAVVAGSLLLSAVGWIESFGEKFENLGVVVKALGVGLIAFGTILSVTLPLQAALGAKAISASIYGIPIVGWISAIISAVIALGVAFYNLAKNNSFETKLKNSQEVAKRAAQAAEEAKDAYEKLNEAWKTLDDKNAAIENITKGTQEWRDAIKEVNDAVLELMNSYGGMIEIGRGENGTLIIKNREEVDQMRKNDALTTEGAARATKIKAYEDEEFKRISNFVNDRIKSKGSGNLQSDYYTAPADLIKKYSYNLDELQSKSDKEIIDLIKQTTAYQLSNKANYDFSKDIQEIRNFIKESTNNNRAAESERTAFGSTILRNAEISEELQPYANAFINNNYVDKLLKKNEKTYEKDNKQDLRDKYAAAHNTTWDRMVQDNPDLEKYKEADFREYLATRDALKEANTQIKAFTNALAKLRPEQKALFGGQKGEGLTQAQLEKYQGYGEAEKKQLFADYGGDDAFGSYEAFEALFNEILDGAVNNFDTSKFAQHFTNEIDKGLTDNLDSGTYKKFMDNLWSVYIQSGKEGVNTIQGSIRKMAKEAHMSDDELKDFIKSIESIDWSSTNSVRTLSDLAKAYGLSEDAVNELEEQIIKFNNAATKFDLKKISEQLKSLLGLGQKISTGSQGRSFSKEDYENLTTIGGMSASDFGYNIATGNYEYIGDRIQDVVDAINRQTDKMVDTKQLEKDVASSTAAQEMWDNGQPQEDSDKIAFIRDYMLKAGNNSKISKSMLQAASYYAQEGNYSTADKLITIIENEAKALGDRQNELNNYAREKDVMKAQANSGSENAARAVKGDEVALEALKTQFAGSNLPEKIKEEILAGINSGNTESINKAGNLVDTSTQANTLGIKSEELDAYAEALQHVKGLQDAEIDELYRLSLAELNYQKGQQAVYDSYDSWSKLIQKNGGIVPDGSIEQGKVFAQLNKDLKQMLNLTGDLPEGFLKAEGRADDLKKAMKGDKKAIAELRKEVASEEFKNFNLGIGDKDKEGIEEQIAKLATEMPDLKIGTTLDNTTFGPALMDMVNKAGMSVDQIQKLFNSLGWAPDITWKKASVEDVKKTEQNGVIKQPDPANPGKTIDVPLKGFDEWATKNDIFIPQVGPKTSYVAPKPPKSPDSKPKTKKKGGGKKGKAKKERWDNPYDELYNLQEKINEALRKREALERRYQKLLKQEQSSLSDIRKSYYDQIKQIGTEAKLQKELEAGRARQINNIGKETYVDSKGKVKTFDQMGVTKYAKYNFKTGEIEMDWAGIQALEGSKNVEKGKAVEAYVSKLEELVKSYEEVRDKLWELEDKIEEYRQAVIDTFLSFEDRVLDAVINKYQKEIDSYQAMSDAIDKVNNEVLSSLREQIDLSRQIRDNTKKEEDISKKENRLAYLRRDTSGANDLEILSLEKELKDAREGYADTLIDQTIDKLQQDADQASEQRQRQIETMQAQLDIAKETGALWQEVYTLMQDAAKSEIFSSDSELAKLLKDGEAFKALSNIGQAKWWEEVGKSFREAIIGRDEAEDKYKTDADNNGTVANTGTSDYLKEIGEMNTQANVTADTYDRTDEQNYGAAAAIIMGGKTHGGWGANRENWESNLKEKGFDPKTVLDLYDIFAKQKKDWDAEQAALQKKKGKYKKGKKKGKWKYTKKAWTGWKTMGVTDWTKYQMSRFKTGGLADTTGPAWLDGTKTNPELVLNAKDTRNFIALKDILASLMNTQKAKSSVSSGDNYFDINIQADIGSDYDVDKLASRIKKIIFEDGQYRNVNTINYLR